MMTDKEKKVLERIMDGSTVNGDRGDVMKLTGDMKCGEVLAAIAGAPVWRDSDGNEMTAKALAEKLLDGKDVTGEYEEAL